MSSHVKAAAPKVKGNISFKAINQQKVGKGLNGGKRKRNDRVDDAEEKEDRETEADDEITDEEEADDSEMEEELDTDDELRASRLGKSKKTAKRKRRATSPTSFGATLQDLLGNAKEDDANVSDEEEEEKGPNVKAGPSKEKFIKTSTAPLGQPAILSLAPHIRRGAQSSRLNDKAARLALAAKRKREDRARVTDVIGGWGAPGELPKTFEGEEKIGGTVISDELSTKEEQQRLKSWLDEGGVQGYEKRLRKSAQRGVVKLFNAIRAAQNTTEADLVDQDGEGKSQTKNEKSVKENDKQTNVKRADNPLGGKTKAVSELSKNNFFDLLRAGTKTK